MSYMRLGLGALVVAGSLYATGSLAADTNSSSAGMQGKSADKSSMHKTMERSASGDVQGIDAKALTLADGKQFRLTDQTQFDRDGKKISRDDIKQGEQVRAAYQARDGLAYAVKIDVLSGTASKSDQPSNAGTGSASSMEPNKPK